MQGLAKQNRMDLKGLEPVGEVALNAVEEYDPKRKDQFHEVEGEPMDSGVFENVNDDNITA